MLQTIIRQMLAYSTEDLEDDEESYDTAEAYQTDSLKSGMPLLPISNQLMDDMAMLSNFDCWIGHTNFDITKDIKEKLNKVEGIELLKILSRYRFFVGIGKMFDFKQVRKSIEVNIVKGD